MSDGDADDGGDEEAVLVANVANDDEADEVSLLQKPMLHDICLFDEVGPLIEETSTSIHFYAMLRSLRLDTVWLPEVLASFTCLLVQITILHGFLYAYLIGRSLVEWNSFATTLMA